MKQRAIAQEIRLSESFHDGPCYVCGTEISHSKRYAQLEMYGGRNPYYVARPVCKCCHLIDEAENEAKVEKRRFTMVSVAIKGTPFSNYVGHRCSCGNAAIYAGGYYGCVRCRIETRMLEKGEASLRLLRRTQTQFNKLLKDAKNVYE